MSDIRFEGWLHRSGTGGVYQDAAGNVGIASTQPQQKLDIGNGGFTVGPTGITTITTLNTTNIINATPLTNRNLMINGAMNVAQRGTSSTSTTHGYHTVDRFKYAIGGQDEAATHAQVDVASGTDPYKLGFRKAFKVTNGNQTSGAGASDYIQIDYYVEARDVANSGWDITNPNSFLTFSFWMKSSVSQFFTFAIRCKDGTEQVINFKTPVLSADTWTKVTKTIPGNANLTVNNDNGQGLQIMFFPFIGTGYSTVGLAEDTWSSWASAKHAIPNTSTWWTTNDATWEITGLQLEVGSVATPFEHRSFAQEVALCQRYYWEHSGYRWFFPITTNSNYRRCLITHPTVMRAAPTASDLAGNKGGSSGTPTGIQHSDVYHLEVYWDVSNESHYVELTAGKFSADL